AGTAPVVTDLSNTVVFSGPPSFVGGGAVTTATLDPGTYLVYVGGWPPAQGPGVKYRLRISIGQSPDNPPALTLGPAPAVSIRAPHPPPPVSPPLLPPLPSGPGISPASITSGGDLPALASLLPGSVSTRGAVGGITAPDSGARGTAGT